MTMVSVGMARRPFFHGDVAEYRRQNGHFDLDQKRAALGAKDATKRKRPPTEAARLLARMRLVGFLVGCPIGIGKELLSQDRQRQPLFGNVQQLVFHFGIVFCDRRQNPCAHPAAVATQKGQTKRAKTRHTKRLPLF